MLRCGARTWIILVGFCYALTIGSCSRYELPSAPADLARIQWTGEAPGAATEVDLAPPFSGSFRIVGQLAQYSAGGPPLRLRVELVVHTSDGVVGTITQLKVSPSDLEARLKLSGPDPIKLADIWPLEPLARLNAPMKLAHWLGRTRKVSGCSVNEASTAKVSLSAAPTSEGKIYTVETGTQTSQTHRGEVTGFVHAGSDGAVAGLRIALRRWSRFAGESCDLVQVEEIEITDGRGE